MVHPHSGQSLATTEGNAKIAMGGMITAQEGILQKKKKTPAKSFIKRKPTTKELLERMEEMHSELQALRQSQGAPLSTASTTPATGITLTGIAPSMQMPMAAPAPSQQLPSLSSQVDWPHLPAPSVQTQAHGPHLPQLSRISSSNIVIREPSQNQSDYGTQGGFPVGHQ